MIYIGILPVVYIAILLGAISRGHVLFAADVNDFRTLAQQFVSPEVAEKLLDIVSKKSAGPLVDVKLNQNAEDEYENIVPEKEEIVTKTDAKDKEVGNEKYNVNREGIFFETKARENEAEDEYYYTLTDSGNSSVEYIYEYESSDESSSSDQKRKSASLRSISKKIPISIDRLVEKVRERLLIDLTKDPSALQRLLANASTVSPVAVNKIPVKYVNKPAEKFIPKIEAKVAVPVVTTKFKDDEYETVEVTPPPPLFKEVNLLSKKEKDSYEDYVAPKKEEDVFATSEEELKEDIKEEVIAKPSDAPLRAMYAVVTTKKEQKVETPLPNLEYDDSNETTTEPELKARTESLFMDYKEDKELSKEAVQHIKQNTIKNEKKTKLGTMIPTRATYKVSSPNYYGQLPTVAERYNFDEPIPEQDREAENLKPIGNPPANINNKIKV